MSKNPNCRPRATPPILRPFRPPMQPPRSLPKQNKVWEPFHPQDSSDSVEHETGHLHHRAVDHRHHRHLLFHP